jgi:DNA-directed RNA polymerase specialized sigma24 family protein
MVDEVMAGTILHLVAEDGRPVSLEVREGVEAAHRWALYKFRCLDETVLAGIAESVAVGMTRHLEEIKSPRNYAFAALRGKVLEWRRAHSVHEVAIGDIGELERIGKLVHTPFLAVEHRILLSEIKARLGKRDREILDLIEHDFGSPKQIATSLGISYNAAAKAIQRVKERMARP